MGNSTSNNYASQNEFNSLSDRVKSLESQSTSQLTSQLPDVSASVTVEKGDAPTSDASMTNGWTLKSQAMKADTPSADQPSASQSCPTGEVVCGISFVHPDDKNYTFQEYFKVDCCKPKVTVSMSQSS